MVNKLNQEQQITVIIPSYNHGKYISYTINSLIAQTYQNLELIIIDDCSQDNTAEIVQSYLPQIKKRFKKFKFIKKEKNSGIVDSLNAAIDLASSDFLYFIASDDIAKPFSIKTLYNFIKDKPQYAMVVGNSDLIDENNKRVYWDEKQNNTSKKAEAKYLTFGDFLKKTRLEIDFNSAEFGTYQSLLKGNYITNNPLFRKSSLIKVGKYQSGLLEDWYMNLQLSKYYKIKYIDRSLSFYRWHSSNTIKDQKKITEITKKTLAYEKELIEKSGNNKLQKDFSEYLQGERKDIFKIPYIFEIYKCRNAYFRKTFIKLFGIKILFREKRF